MRVFGIVRVFRFDEEASVIRRGGFHTLQKKGADAAATVIFHNGEIV